MRIPTVDYVLFGMGKLGNVGSFTQCRVIRCPLDVQVIPSCTLRVNIFVQSNVFCFPKAFLMRTPPKPLLAGNDDDLIMHFYIISLVIPSAYSIILILISRGSLVSVRIPIVEFWDAS